MTRRVALGAGLAGIVLSSGMDQARGQAAEAGDDAEFEGKYLVVYQKTHPDRSSYLEKVRVKQLGDTNFLVGSGIKVDHPAFKGYAGLVHWIPVDEIALIQVFTKIQDMIDLSEIPKDLSMVPEGR